MEAEKPGAVAETEAARGAKKLELLLEISKALSRQQEVDKLLESIADMSFQVMAVDRCSILLGPNEIGSDHIRALHELGYLPLDIRALPEGTLVPMFGIGMNGAWAARYGSYGPRAKTTKAPRRNE